MMDGQQLVTASLGDSPVDRARSVVEILKRDTDRAETARQLTAKAMAALHEARLFRILLPKSLGGDEIDLPSLPQVTEIISAADASAGWCIGQGGGCATTAVFMPEDAARRLFGPKNAILAWGAGVAGTAIACEGGYRVSGKWSFASGSRHATLLGAHCRVLEADGTPRLDSDGTTVDRTAVFPRAKATVHDVWHVMGLKATGSDTYEVKDLFVPAAEVVDRDAWGEAREPATIFRFPSTVIYATAFAGVMLGITRGTLGDLRALAMTKTPRGASSSMRESQVFQSDLAVLEARFRAARALLHTTVTEVWREVDGGAPLTLEHRVNIRLATTHAINEGVDIVGKAYRAAGQTAVFEANPFEQRLRDAHSASQQVQGRPSHYMTVGRHFLDLPPDSMMFL